MNFPPYMGLSGIDILSKSLYGWKLLYRRLSMGRMFMPGSDLVLDIVGENNLEILFSAYEQIWNSYRAANATLLLKSIGENWGSDQYSDSCEILRQSLYGEIMNWFWALDEEGQYTVVSESIHNVCLYASVKHLFDSDMNLYRTIVRD